MAEELGLDIIPVYLYGTGRVLRKKTYHLAKGPIYVEVDKAMTQAELAAKGTVKDITKYFHSLYVRRFEEISNKIEQDV